MTYPWEDTGTFQVLRQGHAAVRAGLPPAGDGWEPLHTPELCPQQEGGLHQTEREVAESALLRKNWVLTKIPLPCENYLIFYILKVCENVFIDLFSVLWFVRNNLPRLVYFIENKQKILANILLWPLSEEVLIRNSIEGSCRSGRRSCALRSVHFSSVSSINLNTDPCSSLFLYPVWKF